MASVSAMFKNNFNASRKFTIWDIGIDPNAPLQLFDDYLDVDGTTPQLQFQQDPGGALGHAQYQRSDGAPTSVDISDGDTVLMN